MMQRALPVLMLAMVAMPLSAFDPDHFFGVWTLDADSGAGIARVTVTPDMQDVLADPGLADLLITDAENQRVPFAMLGAGDLRESLMSREALDYSESSVADADAPAPADTSPLRLELVHDGQHLVISMPRGQPDAGTRQQPVLEALIGASEISDELPNRHLNLRFQSMQQASLDCRLRDADRPDEREQRLRLDDQGERHPYRYSSTVPVHHLPRAWHLRCFADTAPEGLKIEQAWLLAQGFRDHRQLHSFRHELAADGTDPVLALPGAYRVRTIAVNTEQPNVLADLTVSARNHADQPWRRLAGGVLSTLPGETGDANRLALEHRERYRYWRVQVDPPPGQNVTVEFSAEAEEIAFLPQGQGPWRLYAGSSRLHRVDTHRDLIARTSQRLGPAWKWPLATVTGADKTGGPGALEVPSEPLPWRQIVLWAVLGLAALVLIGISIRLLRQTTS